MKIVLIALFDIRSYGIRILHSVLENAGFDVTSIFFHENMGSGKYYTDEEIELLISTIKKQYPDLIGISVRSPLFILHQKIFKKIKENIETKVLVGGHHATIAPEECINYADIVCIGEGEQPTLELCQNLSKGAPINNILNLWVKDNGKIIKNELRPLLDDLDSVPFPSYSRNNQLYIQDGKLIKDGLKYDSRSIMAVITTRGCFFSCSFCYNSTLREIFKGKGQYVRRRSVKNVINEILILKKTFPKLSYIYFSDNVFTYGKDWIKEFCDIYPQKVNLPFGCFGHFLLLDTEILQKLKESGLIEITLGIQSGSQYISQKVYNRKIDKDSIITGSKILSGLGIRIYYDVITNNPYETDQTHKETLDLLMHLQRPYDIRNFKMKYYPKVPLTQKLLNEGIISENEVESNHEKSFQLWVEEIDLSSNKNRQELFWDCIYFMVKKEFPKPILRKILIFKILRRRPVVLGKFLKYLYPIYSRCMGGLKLLLRGEILTFIQRLISILRDAKKDLGWGY